MTKSSRKYTRRTKNKRIHTSNHRHHTQLNRVSRLQSGGNKNLKDLITISILSWKAPMTLKNTLDSYVKNNLFNNVKPSIYFQERTDEMDALAKGYGIKDIMGTSENIGLIKVFHAMVMNTKTPYFIFAECDYELIHGETKTRQVLEDAIKLMTDENVDLVRLRDRKNPGWPNSARRSLHISDEELETYDYSSFGHKLETVSFLNKPEEKMPNVFTIKKPPEYNYKWYICNFLCSKWSGHVFIAKTAFLKETVLPFLEPYLNDTRRFGLMEGLLHGDDTPLKKQLSAQGEGLFKHNRLDQICSGDCRTS